MTHPHPAKSKLKVAVIGHLRHPIAEPFMGGMEAHCALLVRTLAANGHDVTLFASGDSDPGLALHAIAPRSYEVDMPWAHWHGTPELIGWLADAYAAAWEAITAQGFDVVHNNSLFAGLHDWAAEDRVPMVTSLHVPPFQILRDAVARNDAPWLRLTVTSANQLPLWSGVADGRKSIAYNGIDLARFRFSPEGGTRALWCGRITPNKGTVEALRAASAAGIGLDIAGPVDCSDYFAQVAPLITGEHRYLGHLSADALAERMGQAGVMLCTPRWDEPFGLVAAEAMACGTPVAALDRGALREVIGECGVLAADEAGLAEAIGKARAIPRLACRERVERLFGADAMLSRYEESYRTAIAGASSSIASTRAVLA